MGRPAWTTVKASPQEEAVILVQDVVPLEDPHGASVPLSPTTGVERPTAAVSLALAAASSELVAAQATALTLGQIGQGVPRASFMMAPFVLVGLRNTPSPLAGGCLARLAATLGDLGRSLALVSLGDGVRVQGWNQPYEADPQGHTVGYLLIDDIAEEGERDAVHLGTVDIARALSTAMVVLHGVVIPTG